MRPGKLFAKQREMGKVALLYSSRLPNFLPYYDHIAASNETPLAGFNTKKQSWSERNVTVISGGGFLMRVPLHQ